MDALEKIFQASKMLFNNMPFYGILSLRVRKRIDDSVRTACVQLSDDKFSLEMLFNSKFVDDLSVEQTRGLIEHELQHIVLGHLTDPSHVGDHINDYIMNTAEDCEINQYIPEKYLPTTGVTLEKLSKDLGFKLPEKAGSKTYYDLLMQQAKSNPKVELRPDGLYVNGEKVMTMDDHNKLNEIAKAVSEGIVEDAARETVKRRGTLPGAVSDLLKKLEDSRKPVIDWKRFLRRFVHNSYKEYTLSTRRRESRRFDENPGIKHEQEFSLLVAIDSSGSVSNEELQEFIAEIDNIYRTKCDIRILVCDTRIVQDFEYKGKANNIEIKGRGGTSFEPVLDLYAKTSSSCLVYFTDGECPLEQKLRKPVLWILSSKGTDRYLTGCKTVKMR